MYAMAYLWKWKQLAFPTALQYLWHDYYWFETLQQIDDNNIFPAIQDQIQYNGKHIHQVYGRNKLDVPRRNNSGNKVNPLILKIHQ